VTGDVGIGATPASRSDIRPEPIVLPTPFPVGPVNCWLLRGDPLTLVDAGPNTPEALAALEGGLAELRVRIEDIELLILTHQHSDHVGLAATIRGRAGCHVAGHASLADYVSDVQAAMIAEEEWEENLLRLHGASSERCEAFLTVARDRRRYGGAGATLDLQLSDGDTIEAGGRRLRVALRPGHSPTDTLLVDDATGTALAGDHLIAHISSNPLVHRPPTGPADPAARDSSLVAYLDSLARTSEEDLTVLHTGHGASITDYRPLIAERVRLHARRADQVHAALAAEPLSATEVSIRLWPDVPVNQTFLTLCEVLGALDLLELDGRAVATRRGDTLVYETA
jgi:glyoxylase-like metal-dependent hydrolase (beta-lactamase superfamily II)